MTPIAPEIRSLLDWEKRVGERHVGLDVPRVRKVLLEEHDRELRRRGVVVGQVAAPGWMRRSLLSITLSTLRDDE